jgi:hypothetical protein
VCGRAVTVDARVRRAEAVRRSSRSKAKKVKLLGQRSQLQGVKALVQSSGTKRLGVWEQSSGRGQRSQVMAKAQAKARQVIPCTTSWTAGCCWRGVPPAAKDSKIQQDDRKGVQKAKTGTEGRTQANNPNNPGGDSNNPFNL